ncbi:MAG: hypothetical protein QM756_18050 [Polyangiaceae bacterium]
MLGGFRWLARLPSASARPLAAPGTARDVFSRGVGAEPCRREYAGFASCTKNCREHGVVQHASARVLDGAQARSAQIELTTRGCGKALPSARRGAPAGARCEHESVCDPAECTCRAPSEGYRVRACVDLQCAEAALGCRLAPLVVGQAACRP